jgi:hypothetical protein
MAPSNRVVSSSFFGIMIPQSPTVRRNARAETGLQITPQVLTDFFARTHETVDRKWRMETCTFF